MLHPRFTTWLCSFALGAGLVAQDVVPLTSLQLVDSVESPLAYVALAGMPSGGGEPVVSPVSALLADPVLGTLFGGPKDESSSSGKALALMRGLILRGTGDVELALTAVLPENGQPRLILRARLHAGTAARLATMLAGTPDPTQAQQAEQLAVPDRRVGTIQTYRLRSASEDDEEIGMAVVGSDLVVANDLAALEALLTPLPAVTSASPRGKVLARDPRFVAMKAKISAVPGSLLMYADWYRLVHGDGLDLIAGTQPDQKTAADRDDARAVMASVVGAKGGFQTTLLIDYNERTSTGARRPFGEVPLGAWVGDLDLNDCLASIRKVPARQLVPSLANVGAGSLVAAIDLPTLAQRSRRVAGLLRDLADAYADVGLDLERKLFDRLTANAVLHVVLTEDGTAMPVYALQAKSKRLANELFADLQHAAVGDHMGRLREASQNAGLRTPVLEIRTDGRGDGPRERDGFAPGPQGWPDSHGGKPGVPGEPGVRGELLPPLVLCATVQDDNLWFAHDVVALAQMQEPRNGSTPRKSQDAALHLLPSFGGGAVAGLVEMDLRPLLLQFTQRLHEPGKPDVNIDHLPARHLGVIDVEPRGEGTLIRIRLATAR